MKKTHILILLFTALLLSGCEGPKAHQFMTVEEKRAKLAVAEDALARSTSEVDHLKQADAEGHLVEALIDEHRADEKLIELLELRKHQAQEVEELGFKYLAEHPEMLAAKSRLKKTDSAIDQKAKWLRYLAEKDLAEAQREVDRYKSATQ